MDVNTLRVAVMLAGHQDTPRRRANRGPGVEVREAHPLARHAVEVRCGDDLLPVAAELAVAEVVGHDPN